MIGANAVIGVHVRIGRECSIGPGVTITNAIVGNRAILHPGVKVGQDGFGFVVRGNGGILEVLEVGAVIIHDDVEIGGQYHDRPGSQL